MAQRDRNERDRDDAYREGGGAAERLTYLLIGAGIGATVALLFAPKAGRELRGDLVDASRKGIDYGKQGAQVVGQRATELYGTAAERAQNVYGTTAQKAQDLIAAGKEQISARRDQLAAAIDAGKDAYVEEKGRGAAVPSLSPAPSGGGAAGGGAAGGGAAGGGAAGGSGGGGTGGGNA